MKWADYILLKRLSYYTVGDKAIRRGETEKMAMGYYEFIGWHWQQVPPYHG
ncbi:MAG: hypothetical protein WBC82_11235 [Dehalococcoidia bacterium]